MSYTCASDVKPQEGKQTQFFKMMANQEVDFALIGGSRFGGKSELISMLDLLFAGDPKFRSIKFRRSYDEIMGANGLWEKAENQYVHFGATANKSDKAWTFPSGAKALYRHMFLEGDEESHRGKGYSAVMFDEINQFTWPQVKMLQTCLRSEAQMNSFMVGTLNPDVNSWCMKFVEWYLDPQTGFPDNNKFGVIRYYLIIDDEPVFADSEDWFTEHHYDYVNPIVDFETMERVYVPPKRFSFFFFNIFDNKVGMRMNPQYLTELNTLPTYERDTQLFGNWFSQPKNSTMFHRKFLKGLDPNYPSKVPDSAKCVRAWDKAYKEVSEVNKYPDYTASVKMYKDSTGHYYITGDYDESLHDDFKDGQDIIYGRFRKNVGVRDQWIVKQAEYDGDDCTVIIPIESGAGAGEYEQMSNLIRTSGFKVEGAKTGNQKNAKEKRFSAFCSVAEQGFVHILPDTFPNKATLNAYLLELEKFDPEKKSTGTRKDDWVDATSDCYLALQKTKTHRAFSMPTGLTSRNTALVNLKRHIK